MLRVQHNGWPFRKTQLIGQRDVVGPVFGIPEAIGVVKMFKNANELCSINRGVQSSFSLYDSGEGVLYRFIFSNCATRYEIMAFGGFIDPATKKHMVLRVFDNDVHGDQWSVADHEGEVIVVEKSWSATRV
jgi:hypothetical protein